jgi:hypothetical protein
MQRACVIIYRSLEHAFRLLRLPVRARGWRCPGSAAWSCSHTQTMLRAAGNAVATAVLVSICFARAHRHTLAPPCQFRDRPPVVASPSIAIIRSTTSRVTSDVNSGETKKKTALTIPLRWLSLPSADISICARSPRASRWRRKKHYAMSLLTPLLISALPLRRSPKAHRLTNTPQSIPAPIPQNNARSSSGETVSAWRSMPRCVPRSQNTEDTIRSTVMHCSRVCVL